MPGASNNARRRIIFRKRVIVATLHVLQGPDKGRTYTFHGEPTLLGRKSTQAPLTDNAASRRHAELVPDNGRWVLHDLKSANGTHVNGERIDTPIVLKHGDQIKIGSTLLVFTGDESTEQFMGQRASADLVDLDGGGRPVDSSILKAIPANEDSVILAAPEAEEAVRAWRVMYQLASAIGTVVDPAEFMARVMDIICDHVQVDRAFVLMKDEESGELIPQVVRYQTKKKGRPAPITTSRTIIRHVLQKKEGILCTNAMKDQRFTGDDAASTSGKEDSIHNYNLRSVICVPIMAHEEVQGIIHLDSSMSSYTFTHEQLRLTTVIGHISGVAIENAKLMRSRMQNERLTATGETVAYLSHYIKNVLQGLRSGADVLEMGLKREHLETVSEGWRIMQRNLDKTFHLTSNMLAFSKNREPRIAQAQLNKVVQDAVNTCQWQADQKEQMLLTDLDELPAIPLDIDGVNQVVVNIITNAIDAAPKKEGIVNVRTIYDFPNGQAVISIQDNGPGIDEEVRDKMFEPFVSSKGHGGTGLGLAVANKIVKEMNGHIEVTGEEGEGTTFLVKLPAVHAQLFDSEMTQGPI